MPRKKLPGAQLLNGASQPEMLKDRLLVPLPDSFYNRPGVVAVAKDLLGKVLVTNFEGERTAGRIVEVEAYNGVVDRASHAFGTRRTRRTEVMFGPAGSYDARMPEAMPQRPGSAMHAASRCSPEAARGAR